MIPLPILPPPCLSHFSPYMLIEYILFGKHASENMTEKHINIERFITGAPKAHFMGLDMVSPGRME